MTSWRKNNFGMLVLRSECRVSPTFDISEPVSPGCVDPPASLRLLGVVTSTLLPSASQREPLRPSITGVWSEVDSFLVQLLKTAISKLYWGFPWLRAMPTALFNTYCFQGTLCTRVDALLCDYSLIYTKKEWYFMPQLGVFNVLHSTVMYAGM